MFLHDQLLAEMQKLQIKFCDLMLCWEVPMSCETSLRLCLYSSRTLFGISSLQVSSFMSATASIKNQEKISCVGDSRTCCHTSGFLFFTMTANENKWDTWVKDNGHYVMTLECLCTHYPHRFDVMTQQRSLNYNPLII